MDEELSANRSTMKAQAVKLLRSERAVQQRLQAIDFRLEAHGRGVHDPLVRAWWSDAGFAGRCPGCGGWIHFTIRGKRAITAEEASQLPQLPDNWATQATIL